jgi:hypothetical protein
MKVMFLLFEVFEDTHVLSDKEKTSILNSVL